MRNYFQTLEVACLVLLCALANGCAQKEAEKPPLTANQLRGQKLYQASCAVCHRADSDAPLNGPGLKGMYRKKFLTSGFPANDERVEDVIRRGRRSMPGYSQTHSDQQIADIMAYLHSL
ncbi:MAG TPA: cytochrome c [Terriglobales bacterium]|nr:cytochrome c [Terriglobales bacterium]